jgi:3'-phosphoadenosine 5'-phosphosulfate sulfotransferase (PAPS reductase)/FAD synthetase
LSSGSCPELLFPKRPSLEKEGCFHEKLTREDKRERVLLAQARLGMKRNSHKEFDALDLVRDAVITHGNNLSLDWSGGRCSTVVLHMALELKPDIKVNFNNTGVEYPENVSYVHALAKEWHVNLSETHPETTFWNVVKTYGFPQMRSRAFGKKWKEIKKPKSGFHRDKRPMCCELLKEQPSYKFYRENGILADLSGLRACESRVRAIVIGQRGMTYTRTKPYPMTVYHPIALWSTKDLDTYFQQNAIPFNETYRTQIRNGCWPCTGFKSWKESLLRYNPKMYRLVQNMQGVKLISDYPKTEEAC